ncbi:MAG TPA: glycine cleavage system protein H [Anaeromyxobacteraceae bacterium]|jgi:glycine cleavage system H lipoate-binding protein|nr:glycine cleavage system protein H [Anaeromyxobacteraceae bacterium]
MDAIVGFVQAAVTFLGGLAARLGIVLLAMAALAVPALALVLAARGARRLQQRFLGLTPVGRLTFRPGLFYAPGHTWVKPEGEDLRVGLDDLAQKIVPWALAIELPRPGAKLRRGEPAAVISCGGKRMVVAAPASGVVSAINSSVVHDPSLVKSDTYSRGWLFRMTPFDSTWRGFPNGERARTWFETEGRRFDEYLESHLGVAAADGGAWIAPPASLLSDEQWSGMMRTFLGASPGSEQAAIN